MSITPAIRWVPVAIPETATDQNADFRIAGEIAERLVELEETKLGLGADLVAKLANLYRVSPRGWRITVELLAGRMEAVGDSYNLQAHRRGCTKQAVHAEYQQMLSVIGSTFPELASAIETLRVSATAHEDGLNRADALRAIAESEI